MQLVGYLLRRLALVLFVAVGVTAAVFVTTNILPGDPATAQLGVYATPENIRIRRIELGLDKPWYIQYGIYLGRVLKGDFGHSWRANIPVLQEVKERAPATIELSALSLFIAVLVGIPLGILAAVHRNSLLDYAATALGVVGTTAPPFWVGLVLILIFFLELRWFPAPLGRLPPGMTPPEKITGLYVLDSIMTGNWPTLKSSLMHLALPSFTLALALMAPMTRITRSSMIEALASDYARAAKAAGLPEHVVIFRYAFRNSLIPLVTILGALIGWLLGGNVLVETVFSWPGLGYYMTQSILAADYGPVQGLVLLYALTFAFLNLAVDTLYFAVDPRIRVG